MSNRINSTPLPYFQSSYASPDARKKPLMGRVSRIRELNEQESRIQKRCTGTAGILGVAAVAVLFIPIIGQIVGPILMLSAAISLGAKSGVSMHYEDLVKAENLKQAPRRNSIEISFTRPRLDTPNIMTSSRQQKRVLKEETIADNSSRESDNLRRLKSIDRSISSLHSVQNDDNESILPASENGSVRGKKTRKHRKKALNQDIYLQDLQEELKKQIESEPLHYAWQPSRSKNMQEMLKNMQQINPIKRNRLRIAD